MEPDIVQIHPPTLSWVALGKLLDPSERSSVTYKIKRAPSYRKREGFKKRRPRMATQNVTPFIEASRKGKSVEGDSR